VDVIGTMGPYHLHATPRIDAGFLLQNTIAVFLFGSESMLRNKEIGI
jgi:hypothetical protein